MRLTRLRAAVEDGVSAFNGLLAKLADVPTPAGPTPVELRKAADAQIPAAD
jgi:hypothetical protein